MINIYLVRHGETSWNKSGTYQGFSNIPLNERGLAQAQRCAHALKNIKFNKIICSDLSRALTTASIISEQQECPLIVDQRLREINFGSWEGLTYDEIEAKWPGMINEMYADSTHLRLPNGESFQELQDRAWQALEEHLDISAGEQNILVVCHGGTNRALICKLIHASLKHAWNFRQGNTCISKINYYGENAVNTIDLLNDTSHIDNMEDTNLCG